MLDLGDPIPGRARAVSTAREAAVVGTGELKGARTEEQRQERRGWGWVRGRRAAPEDPGRPMVRSDGGLRAEGLCNDTVWAERTPLCGCVEGAQGQWRALPPDPGGILKAQASGSNGQGLSLQRAGCSDSGTVSPRPGCIRNWVGTEESDRAGD